MNILENLNEEQKKAILHIDGALLILAGAGSGKTTVLTNRIAYMINTGISPYNILAITFTNKAAKEMKERISKSAPNGDLVWVNTFHSTCIKILRRERDKISLGNNFSIYDTDDSKRVIKNILKTLNIDEKKYKIKTILNIISSWKDKLKKANEIIEETQDDFKYIEIAKIYKEYEKFLIENNALDFDDIIFNCIELFKVAPDILEKYQDRFKYIMVDEYQDTNNSQYNLVKLLSSKYKNLCVVGDDDQSIYSWRGANINNILNFEKDYKYCITIKLEQNYRSTVNILNCANSIIKNNVGRKDKNLWSSLGYGEKIYYYRGKNEVDEAKFIADTIEKNVNSNIKYYEHAILYRTNTQARALEEQLVKKSIPYKIFGSVNFYGRKEIKDVLAYLKFINNPKDELSLLRIINTPKRGIGQTNIKRVLDYATHNNISFFTALDELEFIEGLGKRSIKLKAFKDLLDRLIDFSKEILVSDLIKEVLEETEYIYELEQEDIEDDNNRVENINELLTKAYEFEKTAKNITLNSFLEDVALISDIDVNDENSNYVSLMTFHASKGLEFECVFLCGFEDSIFPNFQAIASEELNSIEEERRLCYVGITRSKRILYITNVIERLRNGKYNHNAVSRFLKELPEDLIENLNNPKINNKVKRENKLNNKINSLQVDFRQTLASKGEELLNHLNVNKPKKVEINFEVGDLVKQSKYGIGTVLDIKPAGADFEVTIKFDDIGNKKFMAHLLKVEKA